MRIDNSPTGNERIKLPVARPEQLRKLGAEIQPRDTGETEYPDEQPLNKEEVQARSNVRADLLNKVNSLAHDAGILPKTIPQDEQGKADFTQLLGGLIEYFMEHFHSDWTNSNGETDVRQAQAAISRIQTEDLKTPMAHSNSIDALLQRQDIQQRIASFVESYGGSGLLSKDFRSAPFISFTGSAKAMVSNEVLPDLAKFAVLFHEMTGQPLVITSAYRTIDHQKQLYASSRPGMAARPGNSNHNTGHAIDIGKFSFQNSQLGGLAGFRLHARKCNFTKLGHEDWHFDHITKRAPGDQEGGRIRLAQQSQAEINQKT